MNSVGILDIIAVYGSAFIILLLLIATFIFRIIRGNRRQKREQITTPEKPATSTAHLPNISVVPDRMLTSSDMKTIRKNGVIENMELLSPLKRGILWAEILGRPGGRRRRNT